MAIDDAGVIDGAAIDDSNALILLLTDHIPWEGELALSEYDHLELLQNKLNDYVAYVESGQFRQTFPDHELTMGIIRICFKYNIPDICEQYLNVAQNQIGHLGIKIEAVVDSLQFGPE